MDKRYTALSLPQQLALRRQAVEDVLAHPEWSLPEAIRHLKKTMRLTTAELARLAGVGFRTLQDIERECSPGSVQTMNRILGVVGLKLGVVRCAAPTEEAGSADDWREPGSGSGLPGQEPPQPGLPLAEAVEAFERSLIAGELRRQAGNLERTAAALQMTRSALHDKVRKYQLS